MSDVEEKELAFYRFVYERHSVYCNKLAGNSWPWTLDPILQRYRFCCVFRELDRTTKYLIETVIDNKALSKNDKFFNIVLFRIFNKDGFFHEVLERPVTCVEYNPKDIIAQMDAAIRSKKKIWANAYMICGLRSRKNIRPKHKHVQVVYGLWDSLEEGVFSGSLPTTMESLFHRAWEVMFVGPFLAYQVALDVSYIKGSHYPDINSFVKVGPGAVATVRRIYESDSRKPEELEDMNRRLYRAQTKCWEVLREREGKDFRALLRGQKDIKQCRTIESDSELPVRLSDVENCMCEHRKFYNLLTGAKQRKRLYRER